MSEEGEADFDAGQILEEQFTSEAKSSPRRERRPTGAATATVGDSILGTTSSDVAPDHLPTEGSGDNNRSVHGSGNGRRSEHDTRYNSFALPPRSPEAGRRAGNDDHHYRRVGGRSRSRSRSRHRSQSRENARRAAPEYSGEYRSGSYRLNRYGERELSRSGYYRRSERESSSYRRRDSERQPYSRSGYGSRDEVDTGDASRRSIDKERAIEELRLRVRSATERPTDIDVPPATRERSPSTTVRPSDNSLATQGQRDSALEAQKPGATADSATTLAAVVTSSGAAAGTPPGPDVDMDDIEEGEHIEGEAEAEVARPLKSSYTREKGDVEMRSRSRSSDNYTRSRGAYANHSPSRGKDRSRSRTRAYHEPEDRRAGGTHDHPSDGAYRRKYDDQADRSEYRAREAYGSRSAHYSRYGDAGYQSSRYTASGARSPSDAREGGYRSERRHYDSRYDRYGATESRQPALDSAVSASRRPSRSRSRSPAATQEGDRRADRHGYGDRHQQASRSYSRSPSRYAREADSSFSERRRAHYSKPRWPRPEDQPCSSPTHQFTADETPLDGGDSANPPPPPPPPMQASGSAQGASSFGNYARTSSPLYHQQPQDSSHRGYSSRQYNRHSRASRSGTSRTRTPYAGRHEHEGHSPTPSNGGSYGQGYQHSRAQSPGAAAAAAAEPVLPELVLPAFSHGTDLYISRFPESAEWLEVRAQVREQAKRILELSANSRKTEFEMAYATWGVHRAESQTQLALWQIERAEQGLGAAVGRSLMDDSALNDL